VLFREHRLSVLVSAAHRLTYAGLMLLGLALVGVTLVVVDVVYGRSAAVVAGAVALGAFTAWWVTLPLLTRRFGEASSCAVRSTHAARARGAGTATGVSVETTGALSGLIGLAAVSTGAPWGGPWVAALFHMGAQLGPQVPHAMPR
jgi:hypothetical protein